MAVQTLTDVDPDFSLDLFQTGCLDGLAISQTNSDHPSAPPQLRTGKYWTITVSPASCNSGYSAFLTLPTSFTPDANSTVCRYTGATWECARNAFTASSISRWGVSVFSGLGSGANLADGGQARPPRGQSAPGRHRCNVETESEFDLAGFKLYRRQGGTLTKLNRALISSVSGGTTAGHAYSWLDRSTRRGVKYAYRLQAVNLDGTRAWLGTTVARR